MSQIIWKTTKEYVDIDTGEVLTAENVKLNYKPINKKKDAYVQNGHGNVKYTIECRRTTQLNLFGDST